MVLHALTNDSVQDGRILIKQSCHLLYLIEAVGLKFETKASQVLLFCLHIDLL